MWGNMISKDDIARLHDLSGRVAIVTGGSRGLGRAIAEAFSAAGAKVAVASRKLDACEAVASAINGVGGEALPVSTHMGDVAQAEALVDATVAHFGRLDIVVNCAANPLAQQFGTITEAAFDKSFAVNVKGPVFLAQRALPHLAESGHGSVINVVSAGAFRKGPFVGLYTAGKAALWHFTRTMAAEFAHSGVRVNALAPGGFDTDMMPDDPAWRSVVETQAIQGRLGDPPEIVGAALYLASDASSFATGSCLTVDGGMLA